VAIELVSAIEVAEILGVSRQRVHQLAADPHFPQPVADLGIGKVWLKESVLTWMRLRPEKKGGRPRASGGD
jgi:predicted DNA-binding transcriptional regulator AlpA